MKPLFFTGFEQNTTGVWTTTNGTVTVQTSNVNSGTYAMCHEGAAYAEIDLDAKPSEVFISINIDPADVYSGGDAASYFDIEFHLADTKIIKLRTLQADKYWDAYVDGVKVADGSVALVDGWHNIQIRVKSDNTNGTIQTYVNGTLDIIYAGDTKPGTSTIIESVRISTSTVDAGTYCYYDDLFVCVGGWPGDIYIEEYKVDTSETGNPNSYSGWLSSGGLTTVAAFGADLLSADGTACSTSTDNAVLYLPFENTAWTKFGDVLAVKLCVYAKSASADASKIALVDHFEPYGARIGASEFTNVGPFQDLGTSYAWYYKTMTQNSMGAAWKWQDLWWQEYGFKADYVSTISVDAMLIEVARREGVDPYQADTFRFTHDGYLITPWIHSGLFDVVKYFSAVKAFVRNVDADNYRVYLDYRLNNDQGWLILEDNANDTVSSAIEDENAGELSLKLDNYATGIKAQLRFRFESEDGRISPDMIAYVLETFPKIPRRRIFTCTVRVEAYRQNIIGGTTWESAADYYSALTGLIATAEPVTIRSTNPIVDGALVEVVGLDQERIIVDPDNPDQAHVVAILTMLEVD